MIRNMLVMGTAAVLAAGATSAAFAADRFAAPRQPVPYSQLNAYMTGSPSNRAAILAQGSDQVAPTGASTNTSATMPAAPALPNDTATNPAPAPVTAPAPTAAPMPGAVNPAPAAMPAAPGAPAPQ